MTKANWKEAPHDAETYEVLACNWHTIYRFCKQDYFWSNGTWFKKGIPEDWEIIEHRPRIISWEDMEEGMVVRCVDANKDAKWYKVGWEYKVGTDKVGDFGPIGMNSEVTPSPERYTFELVSEPEQRNDNPWDDFTTERDEQEWTHVYGGDKCYIKVTEPDIYGHIVIVTQTDGYVSVCLDDVETIKPTITKAEAEAVSDFARYLGLSNHTFNEYIEKYNVK